MDNTDSTVELSLELFMQMKSRLENRLAKDLQYQRQYRAKNRALYNARHLKFYYAHRESRLWAAKIYRDKIKALRDAAAAELAVPR